MRRVALFGLLLLLAVPVFAQRPVRLRTRMRPTVTSGTGNLLTSADLSNCQAFLTYGVDSTGSYSVGYPITYRYVSGVRKWYQISDNGNLYEMNEPTLVPCSTALASVNTASLRNTYTGLTGLHEKGSQQGPGAPCNGGSSSFCGYFWGIRYDAISGKFIVNWSGWYTNLPQNLNSFAVLTPNDTTHVLTIDGCYAYPSYQPNTGAGTIDIPAQWVTDHLPAGRRIGLLGNVLASATSGNNYGPAIIAIPLPAPNAPCADLTDNAISAGSVLAEYALTGNATGPNCFDIGQSSGFNLDCNPATAPTTPYPARIAFTKYSYNLYQTDWERWPHVTPTTGYYGDYTQYRHTWYDDPGVKTGVFVAILQMSGYLKTTIVSTTGPGQAVLSSIDTNDGYQLNPTDEITINTCRTGIDTYCVDGGNLHQMSIAKLLTVNASTKEITFTITSPDECANQAVPGCTLTPQVGGAVNVGAIYAHSIPGRIRSRMMAQILDPAQYVTVLAGGAAYVPTYNEEFSLYDKGATVLGDPSNTSIGGVLAGRQPLAITSVGADPTAHQIYVAVGNPVLSPVRTYVMLWDVAH